MSRWNLGSDDSPGPTDSSHGEFDRSAGGARCRECNTAVTGESKFCPNCGARMQEVCFACGALSAGGAKFCGDCGADLINGLETQVTLFEEKLGEAKQLLKGSGYDKVVERLLPLTAAKHPILARYATEARELISQSRQLKSAKEEEAKQAYQKSQAAEKRSEYHQALKILSQIELPFRSSDMDEAICRIRPIVNEIDRLSSEIVDRSLRENVAELLGKVERLLELQPGHVRALETAERFRDQAHRHARERLKQGQHDRAAQILDLVPKVVATEETHDLRHRAHEFGSLQWDLFHAPTVDATLVDVGRRLQEIAPENERFKELHGKLTRFAERHAESNVLPPMVWATPPKETAWGGSVEWLTGFGDMEIADTVDQTVLDRFAGSFFPAFGLALQGLGKATIGTCFLKNRKSRGRVRSAWGLDLGPGGLKAVRLDVRKKDQQILVGACDLVEHRKPLAQAAGPDERQQLVAETLDVFRKRAPGKLDRVCVCLPDMQSITRHVKVPPTNADKLAEVMEHEAQVQLAQLPEDLVWDYQPVEQADEASPHRQRQVLLVAVRKSSLQMSLDVLQAAKFKVDQVQVDWLALANALVHLGHLQAPEALAGPSVRSAVAVLDLGSETSQLLVQRPGLLDCRPIRVGGYSFTRALAREFELSVADAENLKRDPRSLELLSRFDEALRPVLDDLVRDMQMGLAAQSVDDKPLGVRRLYAVGGGMRLHGLWRHLVCGR